MQDLKLTSTYAYSKHLTEQLVNSTCIKPGVAKAIVRPSLIAGMAGAPYPGWISGYAGPPGYVMGRFNSGASELLLAAAGMLSYSPAVAAYTLVSLVALNGLRSCA